MARADLVIAFIAGLAAPAAADDLKSFERDLELAYELQSSSQHPTDDLIALRGRAERLTGTRATRGIAAVSGAGVAGTKRRVLGGHDFAVVVDTKNEPIAWYAVDTPKSPCPPCSADARTVVVRAASPHLVEIDARETGPELVVDLTTLVVRIPSGQMSGGTAPSPDGKRLAMVTLTWDENGTCSAQLAMLAANGQLTIPALPSPVPQDMCQGEYAVAWRGSRIVVTSDWSADHVAIAIASGAVSTLRGTSPAIGPRPTLSRPLTKKQRAVLAKVGCTVDGRFVFPTAACGDLSD